MVKTKAIIISNPMDAKHIGGVNVMASSGQNLRNYFPSAGIIPDERPSHTFVAIGKTEAPRRSDTIASTIRRPSISLKRSLSRLRRKSFSHHPGARRGSAERYRVDSQLQRPDSTTAYKPLAVQRNTSIPRQRVASYLDADGTMPVPQSPTLEVEDILEPKQDTSSKPRDNRALAPLTTTSSIYSTATDIHIVSMSTALQRKPVANQQWPLPSKHTPLDTNILIPQPPEKISHPGSSTAIDIRDVPIEERPIPFREIMAVSSLSERMNMYKKTRDYWATVDHGLLEWVERAAKPKTAVLRS
ncbi:hypothetical protein DDE83_003133 [Stemphylium lycopersici]|uniref:Uncharacterized protein n=1 Tax=Stemphylium lycopersici TaxID=183478 RepID=A0A364N8P2_STELY|nr:hypothetical protein DDE83_003133 [Stemphylium lycopersici]